MGSVAVARVIEVASRPQAIVDRVRLFAQHNDFRVVEEREDELVFKRGGGMGDWLSFDVHNVSTKLVVTLGTIGGGTRVTASMKARAPLQIFTGGDRATLQKDMDVFVDMVRSIDGR